MTLWLVFALMTAAAVLACLFPLLRRSGRWRTGSEIAVYRDQLEEIRRGRSAGLIGSQEAAAVEIEVSRRLLAAARPTEPPRGTPMRPRAMALAVLLLLPIGAAGIYLALGSPMLPDQPLASRAAQSPGNRSVEDLVGQVEAHLERQQDDGRGWEVIAPVYIRLGRFGDAVKARRNALRLNGETADREAALGEALALAANGVITTEAKDSFEKAVALDANHVQARYFLGIAAEQDGQQTRAAAIWSAMLASAPPDARWAEPVKRALQRVGGSPAQAERPGPGPTEEQLAGSRPAGPNEEQVRAASQLDVEQRNIMIRGMVERLADRLTRSGVDPDGWVRLVRSYIVLGEPDKARAVLAEARRALAGDPAQLQRFEEMAKELKVEG